MAFDGIVIANLVNELNQKILNGRIYKIAQPETDELILTIKNGREQFRLFISASASLPLLYFTNSNKQNPLTAPNFCMLLRKHLNNGRITKIYQPGMERIINFEVEHLNELGDLCQQTLVVELMGKHSNIIFLNDKHIIIDSIKHIPGSVSSVREVLPGREYFIPHTMDKLNPLTIDFNSFKEQILTKNCGLGKAIYTSFTGISPVVAYSICTDSSLPIEVQASLLSEDELLHLFNMFQQVMELIKEKHFSPVTYFFNQEPKEYSSVPLSTFSDCTQKQFSSISEMLEQYYSLKNILTRMHQKSADLRRIVQTALEKDRKKYNVQLKQLKDTEKKEKYKVYGELISAYGYQLEKGAKVLEAENYYNNNALIRIPLDPDLSPIDNAKKYFDKYTKLKRTAAALNDITKDTSDAILHLESIATALDFATDENCLKEIKEELIRYGYIKKHGKTNGKKEKYISHPLHYISSDGFHMYVGKNNFQNEELSFHFASGNDYWFHAKSIPGSHVIVKTNGKELTDKTYEEAAALAAYYSKGRDNEKVDIDYTLKKNLKKVNGAKPGFVIYHTNYTMTITPDISHLKEVKEK